MKRLLLPIPIIVLMLSMGPVFGISPTEEPAHDKSELNKPRAFQQYLPDGVNFKSRQFIPAQGVSEAARAHIRSVSNAHVLVQLKGIPTDGQRIDLEVSGVTLLSC